MSTTYETNQNIVRCSSSLRQLPETIKFHVWRNLFGQFTRNAKTSTTCCKIKNLYFLKEPKKNEYKINDHLGKVARKSRSKAVYIKICESDLIGSTPASNVPRLVMVIFRQGGF